MKAGEYMKRALSLQKIVFRFFILLITISVSFSILPGGIIPSYGLFGEITSFYVIENQISGIQSNPIKANSNKQYKTRIDKKEQKAQYERLLLLTAILCMLYLKYLPIFLNFITPAALKVRMNN
jgi:hypothetical protein